MSHVCVCACRLSPLIAPIAPIAPIALIAALPRAWHLVDASSLATLLEQDANGAALA